MSYAYSGSGPPSPLGHSNTVLANVITIHPMPLLLKHYIATIIHIFFILIQYIF